MMESFFLQISSMLLFVKQYKQEVLGVGEVALPGEGEALREAAIQRTAKEVKEHSSSNKKDAPQHQDHGSSNSSVASPTNGTEYNNKTEYVSGCMTLDALITSCYQLQICQYEGKERKLRLMIRGFLFHDTTF